MLRGGHSRDLHIDMKTSEFIAGRDVVPKAKRGG